MKLFATLALLLMPALLHAQQSENPDFWLDGPTNAGTEFFLSFPTNWEYTAGQKYVRLYIGAAVETEVRVTVDGRNYEKILRTVPHGIISLDLANNVAQVIVRNDQSPIPNDALHTERAIRIESEAPIIVTAINRTQFTTDALLALPINALGREYIVASARSVGSSIQELPSQFVIAAPYDDTQVQITFSDDTPNHREGETITVTMNRGDVYSAMSTGYGGDLTGSRIVASRPVALFGGQNCTYLPDENYPACDHLVEMLTPVESWGTLYHSLPFQNRTKGDTYRIFAGEPNAKIFINGELYATLSGVGGGEAFGWIEYRQDERTAMVFSSDKPISVAQYNNSQTYDNASATDPFFIVLTPVEQYRSDLIFTTPSDDFSMNWLGLIADSASLERMEIAKVGTNDWHRVRTYPGAAGYRTFGEHDGRGWAGLTLTILPGVWQIRGAEAMSAYLYGGGNFDSYGHPAGMTTFHFSTGDTAAPALFLELDSCTGEIVGSVRDGNAEGRSSGISSLRLGSGTDGYSLDLDDFRPGVDSSVGFRLESLEGYREGRAEVIVWDMAGNRTAQKMIWEGSPFRFDRDTVDAGTIMTGEQKEIDLVLRNSTEQDVTITELLLRGTAYGIGGLPSLPLRLSPGDSLIVTVTIRQEAPGDYEGILEVSGDCGTPRVVITTRVDDDTDVPEGDRMPERLDLSLRRR